MPRALTVLEGSRLDENTLSLGCLSCPLRAQCGGYTRAAAAWSCMDRCEKCDKSKCTTVCLKKPAQFVVDLAEVRGFGYRDLPRLVQGPREEHPPPYVPVIKDKYQRGRGLAVEWAALPLDEVFKLRRGRHYGPVADSPAELRAYFGLSPATKILLRGTGKDPPIERYWHYRSASLTSALAALDIAFSVVPNYSLFLADPRPHHFFNRKRSLVVAGEWAMAGIRPIPYLQALTATDWRYWVNFLQDHPEVTMVAKEFETGLRKYDRGLAALRRLAELQESVGRSLHLVAIGATQYVPVLAKLFSKWSIVEGQPFMKAIHRRAAVQTSQRLRWRSAVGERVDDLLEHNISLCARRVERAAGRGGGA